MATETRWVQCAKTHQRACRYAALCAAAAPCRRRRCDPVHHKLHHNRQTSAKSSTQTHNRYKVYTRTGDAGSSSLYNGERRAKDDAAFAALGDVDELNSALGAAREFCLESAHGALPSRLAELQSRLLDVGSAVATPLGASSDAKRRRGAFSGAAAATARLEAWIDEMDAELPPLRNFILPSGGRAAALLHVARAVCRRAERAAAPLVREGQLDGGVLAFLNRLSDFLFQAARWAALKEGKEETVYKKGAEDAEEEAAADKGAAAAEAGAEA